MHIPLVIAILAFLAFALLPVLDHFNTVGDQRHGPTLLLDPYRALGEGVSQARARLSLICTFAEAMITFN